MSLPRATSLALRSCVALGRRSARRGRWSSSCLTGRDQSHSVPPAWRRMAPRGPRSGHRADPGRPGPGHGAISRRVLPRSCGPSAVPSVRNGYWIPHRFIAHQGKHKHFCLRTLIVPAKRRTYSVKSVRLPSSASNPCSISLHSIPGTDNVYNCGG